jgi:hypothetical protein
MGRTPGSAAEPVRIERATPPFAAEDVANGTGSSTVKLPSSVCVA